MTLATVAIEIESDDLMFYAEELDYLFRDTGVVVDLDRDESGGIVRGTAEGDTEVIEQVLTETEYAPFIRYEKL